MQNAQLTVTIQVPVDLEIDNDGVDTTTIASELQDELTTLIEGHLDDLTAGLNLAGEDVDGEDCEIPVSVKCNGELASMSYGNIREM